MDELLEEYRGELKGELEDSVNLVNRYINEDGYDWVSAMLEELDDLAYIESVAKGIREQLKFEDYEYEPFTAEDEKYLKMTNEMVTSLENSYEKRKEIREKYLVVLTGNTK